MAFGLLSLGPSVTKPLATNLCPGAWGMLALGPVLVVLGPGLILVPGKALVPLAIAWSLPALVVLWCWPLALDLLEALASL